jgi:hypothetical protein
MIDNTNILVACIINAVQERQSAGRFTTREIEQNTVEWPLELPPVGKRNKEGIFLRASS